MDDFKNMLLKYLYGKGYRYIVKDRNSELCAYLYKPFKSKVFWAPDHYNEDLIGLDVFKDLFSEVKWENREPFDIGKQLGIINWSEIPVDTKVLVRDEDDDKWEKRHFAGVDAHNVKYPFLAFTAGKTSWSACEDMKRHWKQCKLVKEKD